MCPGFVEFHFWINCKDVRVWVSLGWFITVSLSVQHSGHWRLSLLEPRVGSRSDSLATFDTASTLLTAATLRTRRYCPSRDTGGDDRELGALAGPGPRPGVREFLGWTQGDTRHQAPDAHDLTARAACTETRQDYSYYYWLMHTYIGKFFRDKYQ